MRQDHSISEQDSAGYQFRITVSPWMGPVYQWLTALPPSVRSKELMHMIRLGFSVAQGHMIQSAIQPAAPMATSVVSVGVTPSSRVDTGLAANREGPADGDLVAAEQAARQQIAAFDANWDIASMITPPSMEKLGSH